MQLDYHTFDEPVTEEQIRHYAAKDVAWVNKKTFVAAGVLLWIFLAVPLFVGVMSGGGTVTTGAIVTFVILTAIAWGVAWAAMIGVKIQARRTVRLKRFAENNQAILSQNVTSPNFPGMIFNKGHTRSLEESFTFLNGIQVGNYSYVIGSGKNRVTYSYGFTRIALKRNLPHMVLDAKSNNFFGSNLPDTFAKSQKLVLEGDFNSYFTVYVPEGYGRDALYVFTPDVMQVLVDKGAKYDMEIIDDEIVIFKIGKLRLDAREDLEGLLTIADSISTELRDQSKRYLDERRAEDSRARVGVGVVDTKPAVALAGRRLRRNYSIFGYLLFAFFFMLIVLPPILRNDFASVFASIGWAIVIMLTIGGTIIKYLRRR
jgi:hypothetical protein